MKNIVTIFLFLIVGQNISGQIVNPVLWRTKVEQVSDREFDLVIKAKVKSYWHLYAQEIPPNGPSPTVFSFEPQDNYQLVGKVQEIGGKVVQDPVFKIEVKYFEKKATFKQRIRLTDGEKAPIQIQGEVEFMACDDERCLPPKFVDLSFDFSKISPKTEEKKSSVKKTEKKDNEPKVTIGTQNEVKNRAPKTAPTEKITTIKPVRNTVDTLKSNVTDKAYPEKIDTAKAIKNHTETLPAQKTYGASTTEKGETKRGLFGFFLIAFLSGFAALLTPCVFPMIPLTVSFFTKQSENKAKGIKNAILYGTAIIVIYIVLGTIVTVIFGADSLNALATNVWFNLVFFLLLVVFALSFLGAFEIVLPNSWLTKVDSRSRQGGFIGIFFMALALALVSFSCTGPIVGTILVEAASKGGMVPIMGMLGFSMAIALPFGLFAAFPGWLNSLPKSGGWLNTVKVVLGFLELALAFKFLSQADLVLQLHFLEREVFLAIWIAIFAALSLYLFGKIQLPHDGQVSHISVSRLSLGLLTLAFVVYMIPGLWGAPLNLISAFPPPQEYSESPYGVGGNSKNAPNDMHKELPKGSHLLAPHDILAFNDYDTGLAYAKKVGKPVMIDFTGWACVNCRKMEQNVWPRPKVLEILKNKVVLISLYVDDKRPLPKGKISESKLRPGKKLKYVGQKWSEFQTIKYKANTQPFYVLMDHQEKNLVEPTAYTPNVDDYHDWLLKGVKAFRNNQNIHGSGS